MKSAASDSRRVVHLIEGDDAHRAAQTKALIELGWKVVPYSNLDAFCRQAPSQGVVLMRQRSMLLPVRQLLALFGEAGLWIPLIVYAREPRVEQVIDALKNGALDYLCLPIPRQKLSDALARAEMEGAARADAHRKRIEARRKIRELSERERQVLEWLAEGCSNKAIARHLGISPRTVEIHRANMKEKLGVEHPAQVARLFLDSGLEWTVEKPKAASKPGRSRIDLQTGLRDRLSEYEIEAEPTRAARREAQKRR